LAIVRRWRTDRQLQHELIEYRRLNGLCRGVWSGMCENIDVVVSCLGASVMRTAGHALCLVNPRAGHFTLFAVHVMTHSCIAPTFGKERIEDYFRNIAEAPE
jgi:hypothetical protein